MSRKKWVISPCDRDAAASISENCGVDPFAAYLLCARGITDEFEVESFLYDTDLMNPFELPDMDKAAERTLSAIENGEKITVFGDYDADGVTSTALLYSYLKSKGACVDYYIPDRAGEGYGMSIDAIQALKERGTELIITVDNGISAIEEVEYAHNIGIDVVVTDHHRVGEALPRAVAVVDPHRADAELEFREWAGVGVAFKFICALEGDEGYELLEQYGDIVALGTVADIVSLRGENRIIVRSGIAYMNAAISEGTLRPGLAALLEASGSTAALDASSLAFRFAPRINAAGRMGSAYTALRLLLSESREEAIQIAEEISQANTERQTIELQIAQSAIDYIEENPHIKYQRVIVVAGKDWHQGVIGIVASRLVEKYGKPAIIISRSGEIAKGSGRSIEGFSLYDALSYCSELLIQYGGHTLAAGMSIEDDKIDQFREKINEYASGATPAVPVISIDCKLNPASINPELVYSMQMLEPFGAENPQPLFGLYGMELTGVQPVGGGKHLRMNVRKKGCGISVIAFSLTEEDFPYAVGDTIDIAARLSLNEYQGRMQVSIQGKAFRLSGTDDEKVIASVNDYERFCSGESLTAEEKSRIALDRDFCGRVYKFIRASKGKCSSAELIVKKMGLSEEKIASCQIALDIFCELGLIINKDGKYILPAESKRVALEESSLFQRATM